MTTATRKTAPERREAVLEAARAAFARGGLDGTSTEDIARGAGISQPYLFRLFGTKKALFVAAVEACFDETLEVFRIAAGDRRGKEALGAMGDAYVQMVVGDRNRLLMQMQSYAACGDPDVRDVVRRRYGDLVRFVELVSGLPPADVSTWFAKGMFLNVIAAIDLWGAQEPWARRLVEGCLPVDGEAAR